MAEITPKKLEKLKIENNDFDLTPWGLAGMSREYFLTLLSRDEYCPVADKQPTEKDVFYTDPASGNLAGFHSGQCVIYPDASCLDGWGLSIAKKVETDTQGVPTMIFWEHIKQGGVSWGKIAPKPYKFKTVNNNLCQVLIDKEWIDSLLPSYNDSSKYDIPEQSKESINKLLKDIQDFLEIPDRYRYNGYLRDGSLHNTDLATSTGFLQLFQTTDKYSYRKGEFTMENNYIVCQADWVD